VRYHWLHVWDTCAHSSVSDACSTLVCCAPIGNLLKSLSQRTMKSDSS
jgi:hypothetical protein